MSPAGTFAGAGAVDVTFDDQIFTGQRYGGVSMYFAKLLSMYVGDPTLGVRASTPFRWVKSTELLAVGEGRFTTVPFETVLGRGRLLRAANAVRLRARFRPPALLHHTFYLPEYLDIPAVRRISTVHDMIPELMPELFHGYAPHFAKADYVRASDAVVCVSQTTKDDLLRLQGPLDKPVEVTPLGVASTFADALPRERRNQYLYVGRRERYKNFDVTLRALARLPDSATSLLCVGGGAFEVSELSRIDELGLTGRVEQRSIPGAEMPDAYASSLALVFPSLYEGFGLPIVEAFAAGCPVVVADTPCSIEVSGGAAGVFPADDDEALAAVLDELRCDARTRDRAVETGRRRAADFSWRRTAALTADVYRRIAAG